MFCWAIDQLDPRNYQWVYSVKFWSWVPEITNSEPQPKGFCPRQLRRSLSPRADLPFRDPCFQLSLQSMMESKECTNLKVSADLEFRTHESKSTNPGVTDTVLVHTLKTVLHISLCPALPHGTSVIIAIKWKYWQCLSQALTS